MCVMGGGAGVSPQEHHPPQRGWRHVILSIPHSTFIYIYICIYTSYKIYLFICIFTYVGFPDNSVGKQSACNAGDPRWIPGLGRSPGEGIGYPLQYSGLENSMDCIVHGVTKSQM